MALFGRRKRSIEQQYTGINTSVMIPRYTTPPERNTREWLDTFRKNPRLAVVNRIASDLSTCKGKLYKIDEVSGDEVEIQTHPFIDMIENNHRVIVPFRLDRSGNGFSFDCERYREESRDCSAVLFCSPHNPTGIVFSEAELECVLTSARERGQIVLCDEIHSDLSYPSFTHTPLIRANDGIGARCITFSAASKSFNIAGEHCAFASFSHKRDRQAYERWQKRLYLTSPGYSVAVMAEAAYRDGLEYNRALCRDLSRKAEKVRSFIKEKCPLLTFCTPHASFIAFIDCSAILDKVIEDRNRHPEIYGDYYLMSHFFGQRGGICMNDGTWFGGEDYKAYVRFNFGCGDDLLDKGLEGIKKAYDYITKQ